MQRNTASRVSIPPEGRKLTRELQVGRGEGAKAKSHAQSLGMLSATQYHVVWYPKTLTGNRASHSRRYLKGGGSVSTVTLS